MGSGPRRAAPRRGVEAVGRQTSRALGVSSAASALRAGAVVLALVLLSWAASWAAGGAGRVVPHWYYFPVILAALRFGHIGALVVAVVSGLLAGPLTPQLVAEAQPQTASEWLTRMAFFVAVGQTVALLVQPALPSMTTDLRLRRAERDMRRALARDELELWYQPVVSVPDGHVVAAEALVRWRHPEHGLLTPGAFLPDVERTSAIHDLGAWVLRRACAEAVGWPDPALAVSVNVSGVELGAPELPDRIAGALDAAGLAPSRLWIEVTESALVDDLDGSADRLARLGWMGVRVAIDDFGTGYSSLSYIDRLPADLLKVDRSFTARLEDDSQGEAVVGGILLLARTLGMRATVEGVETDGQARRIADLGCDLAQGFRYHRPMPAGELAELLLSQVGAGRGSAPVGNGWAGGGEVEGRRGSVRSTGEGDVRGRRDGDRRR